jgi:hypothetical protein
MDSSFLCTRPRLHHILDSQISSGAKPRRPPVPVTASPTSGPPATGRRTFRPISLRPEQQSAHGRSKWFSGRHERSYHPNCGRGRRPRVIVSCSTRTALGHACPRRTERHVGAATNRRSATRPGGGHCPIRRGVADLFSAPNDPTVGDCAASPVNLGSPHTNRARSYLAGDGLLRGASGRGSARDPFARGGRK